MAEEDTEITLGMGKLLGLFFMLAATCGVFFAVGYSLGKTAEREQALKAQAAQTLAADADAANPKPAGAPVRGTNGTPAAENGGGAKETAPDLTFYKSVKQNPNDDTKAQQGSKSSEATVNAAGGSPLATKPHELSTGSAALSKPVLAAKAESPTPQVSMPQANPSGSYLVQIAAVSHE